MIDILCINGERQTPLRGSVKVGGAKNASLPLLFASLLTTQKCTFTNIPDLEDISVTLKILKSFGSNYQYKDGVVSVESPKISNSVAPYGLVKTLRASFWLMGPLLARIGKASISLPGGDAIGTRPVDIHLKALSAFGADFRMEHGVVHGNVPGELHPAEVSFPYPSVGATHNALMAAALIPGKSIIRGVAKEPEVVDLCKFLSALGAEIEGAGTDEISIIGKKELGGCEHEVIGDRIEAVTYLLAGLMTSGDVTVTGIDPNHARSSLDLLKEMGATIETTHNSIRLKGVDKIKAVSFSTAPFPGVATDVQPLFLAAATLAEGVTEIHETVFESRFGHVAEYRRFGADIRVTDRVSIIKGVQTLSGAPVEALDIRAAAGLVLLGVVADGVTQIRELHHLDRGYENLVQKFSSLGAKLSRIPSVDSREIVVGC